MMIPKDIIIFFVLQLVNVILSTTRSILTVKANAHVSAIVNAVSYTFYNLIVKMITAQDTTVILVTTFVTNLLGVYIARWALNLFRKEKLWVFNATLTSKKINCEEVIKLLEAANIKYLYNTIVDNKLYSFQVFSYNCRESDMIKKILERYSIKFYVVESKI